MAKEINFIRPQEVYEDGKSVVRYRSYDGSDKYVAGSTDPNGAEILGAGRLNFVGTADEFGSMGKNFPFVMDVEILEGEIIESISTTISIDSIAVGSINGRTASWGEEVKTFATPKDALNWVFKKGRIFNNGNIGRITCDNLVDVSTSKIKAVELATDKLISVNGVGITLISSNVATFNNEQ